MADLDKLAAWEKLAAAWSEMGSDAADVCGQVLADACKTLREQNRRLDSDRDVISQSAESLAKALAERDALRAENERLAIGVKTFTEAWQTALLRAEQIECEAEENARLGTEFGRLAQEYKARAEKAEAQDERLRRIEKAAREHMALCRWSECQTYTCGSCHACALRAALDGKEDDRG